MFLCVGRSKFKYHDEAMLNRTEFDKVIGDCEAVTDLPAAAFGVELLRAYPDVKVVLNRRKDVDAWYDSQKNTIDRLYKDWPSWLQQWFDAEIFWIVRIVDWTVTPLTGGDFAKNGKQMYHDHYAALEAECRSQGREWLDWTVEDGWESLCAFLGKPVPDEEFPQGNASDAFNKRRAELHGKRRNRAKRNMAITAALATVVISAGLGWYFYT